MTKTYLLHTCQGVNSNSFLASKIVSYLRPSAEEDEQEEEKRMYRIIYNLKQKEKKKEKRTKKISYDFKQRRK